MQQTPRVVEVVGIPGVGKTSVSRRAVRLLSSRGLHYRWRSMNVDDWRRWPARGLGALANPRLTWALLRHVDPGRVGPAISASLHLLPRSFLQSRLRGQVIVDSGTLFTASAAARDLRVDAYELLRHLPLPDIVVSLRVPADVALDRIRTRGRRHPVFRLTTPQAHRFLADYQESLDAVLDAVDRRVVTIEVAGMDIEETAALLADRIGEG